MTMKPPLSLLIAIIILVACTHPSSVKPKVSTNASLDIFLSSNRFLEMESCGCSTNPLGGMDRDWNVVGDWKKETTSEPFYFVTGTSFVPQQKDYRPDHKNYYTKKSEVLIDAFNELGVTALAPTVEDLQMGIGELESLRVKAKFSFVSTNLYSARTAHALFTEFLKIKRDDLSIIVLGIARPSALTIPGLQIKPPEQALAEVLPKVADENSVVILLSDLTPDLRLMIAKKFPRIQLFLGGDESDTTSTIEQLGKNSLYMNPYSLGRAIARLRIDVQLPLVGFYNPEVASYYSRNAPSWKDALAQEKDPERIGRLKQLIAKSEDIALTPSNELSYYRADFVSLREQYSLPANPLTKLLQVNKETLRKP